MARTYTNAKPLPLLPTAQRFLIVGWNFLIIYLSYKRIQRVKGLTEAERQARYATVHAPNAERLYKTAARLEGLLIKTCQFISSRADIAPPEYVAIL